MRAKPVSSGTGYRNCRTQQVNSEAFEATDCFTREISVLPCNGPEFASILRIPDTDRRLSFGVTVDSGCDKVVVPTTEEPIRRRDIHALLQSGILVVLIYRSDMKPLPGFKSGPVMCGEWATRHSWVTAPLSGES